MLSSRAQAVREHCERALGSKTDVLTFNKGPVHELPEDFCVLECAPSEKRNMWVYLTCGMSFGDANPIEMYMFAPRQAPEILEMFYAIAHYHLTGEELDATHTVNFGRPWLPGSKCDYGLLSFMDAEIDWAEIEGEQTRFLWLIPITKQERDYKIEFGFDALDEIFVDNDVNVDEPTRESAV